MCWTVDPCGKQGEACIFTLLGMRFAWHASDHGGNRLQRERACAWQVWGIVHGACVSRSRRGESRIAGFHVDVPAGAKSWQAQGVC